MKKKRKAAYDYARMEKEPPRVPDPWSIAKGSGGRFVLSRGKVAMMECLSQSEDGAHREAMWFIKEIDF